MITRSEWGARPAKRTSAITDKSGGVVVHYTAVDSSLAVHWPDCYDRWQRHQNYHMDVRGWNDLAYNFGVCKDGFVFEGRGWENRNGANTPENGSTLSICVDVDGDQIIDRAVVNNVNALIAEAVNEQGWARRLRGHFEVSTTGTACPGAQLKRLLDDGTIRLPSDTTSGVPTPGTDPDTSGSVPLMGGDISPLTLQAWARSHDATSRFVELLTVARRYSLNYGTNPAIVAAIMAHETGFGRFGGVVPPSFHNWGGIKTTTGGSNAALNAHARFNDDHLGVLAVVQHVAGYAGLKLPVEDVVDPRYHLLEGKQIAAIPSSEWSWASDGEAHALKIVKFAGEIDAWNS